MTRILQSPAYQHLLLNHLPLIGLGLSTLMLFCSILMRNSGARILSLVLVTLTAASAWPVYATGQRAYIGIRGVSDDAGVDWLDTHMDRANRAIFLFALPVALGLAAIFLPRKWPRTTFPLAIAVLISANLCLTAAAWIAEAGGKIKHPELRIP